MPFLIEKVLEILYHIIKPCPDDDINIQNHKSEHIVDLIKENREERASRMNNKLKAVARLMNTYRGIREDKEDIIKL